MKVVIGAATAKTGSTTTAGQAQGHARRLEMITAMHHRRRGAARGAGRRRGTLRRFGPHGPQYNSDRRQAVAEHRRWAAHSGAMTSNEAFQISAAGAEAYEAAFI